MGASAGGLEALERLFEAMPPNTGLAFVVLQHLSPDFKSLTDELLGRKTPIPIRQAENDMTVEADCIYLLPPRKDMILSDGRLLLSDKDPSQLMALPIDRFFRSLAQDVGRRAVGVVLSGTGSDGSRGIRDIHEAGGLVIAQTPETAKFDGMPRAAAATGVVNRTLSPEEIPAALVHHVRRPHGAAAPGGPQGPPLSGMDAIFGLLRDAYSIDFTCYKPDTVARRTERRLGLQRSLGIDEYARQLAGDPHELNRLYQDLLIGVTGFFRDPEAFDHLATEVLPGLLRSAGPGEEFRAWVAGCATGQEAYTLAILLHEQLASLAQAPPIKIFATDVHRASLDHAGAGFYRRDSLTGLSPERLQRYFTPRGEGYQVVPEIRRLVVFAEHNVLRDAPFTKLDLVTCRNLLIYFQPPAQKKVLSLFHFGLKPRGGLFLGPSEGPGELADEFDVVDGRWKIYRKRRDVRLAPDVRLTALAGTERWRGSAAPSAVPTDVRLAGALDALLDEAMPPSILVNERREVVRTFGGASRYLRLRDGWTTTDVLDLVDPELRTALAGALPRAFKAAAPVHYQGLHVRGAEGERLVNVIVKAVPVRRSATAFALIRLEEQGTNPRQAEEVQEIGFLEASREQVQSLELELRTTKENLQAMIEELETSNEELQATNEELVASNEELQSTNEELHSVNEELYTVNAEYQKKIAELTELTADMDNLLTSTEVHTIFLDENLCIRKFTPRIAETFHLLPQDVGRRIEGFTYSLNHPGLLDDLAAILNAAAMIDRAAPGTAGEWHRVIERRARHMARLLDDLLDVARMTRNKIEIRRQVFDLGTLVPEVLEEIRPWFEERHLRLEVMSAGGPVFVDGDPNRLQQMQVNLLMNAAKYTSEGG